MDALADDLLFGAEAIAEFLFGDRKKRRRVYHLNSTGQLPLGKMGETSHRAQINADEAYRQGRDTGDEGILIKVAPVSTRGFLFERAFLSAPAAVPIGSPRR